MSLGIPLFSLALAALAAPPPPPPVAPQRKDDGRYVLTGTEAVLLAPAEAVSGGSVHRVEWSPSSRYVLALRDRVLLPLAAGTEKQAVERSLVLWSSDTHKSTELWHARGGDGSFNADLAWFGGSDTALVLADYQSPAGPKQAGAPERWAFRVDARRGTIRPLFVVGRSTQLLATPLQANIALFTSGEADIRFVRPDGTVRVAGKLAAGVVPHFAFWRGDSAVLVISTLIPSSDQPNAAYKLAELGVDPATGAVAALTGEQRRVVEVEPTSTLHLQLGTGEVTEGGTRRTLHPLWLTGSGGPAVTLVAPDASWGKIAPDGSAVLYLADETAWLRPLVRLSGEQFRAMRETARRATYMSHARQLGLAFHLYAQDHENQLPAAGDAIQSLLLPYVDTEAPFDGFVYTFPGGKLTDIPATVDTMLGYTPLEGGRIVLFADGHVAWQADKK